MSLPRPCFSVLPALLAGLAACMPGDLDVVFTDDFPRDGLDEPYLAGSAAHIVARVAGRRVEWESPGVPWQLRSLDETVLVLSQQRAQEAPLDGLGPGVDARAELRSAGTAVVIALDRRGEQVASVPVRVRLPTRVALVDPLQDWLRGVPGGGERERLRVLAGELVTVQLRFFDGPRQFPGRPLNEVSAPGCNVRAWQPPAGFGRALSVGEPATVDLNCTADTELSILVGATRYSWPIEVVHELGGLQLETQDAGSSLRAVARGMDVDGGLLDGVAYQWCRPGVDDGSGRMDWQPGRMPLELVACRGDAGARTTEHWTPPASTATCLSLAPTDACLVLVVLLALARRRRRFC
ncbi:MAG: hypothetical protein HY904_04050 [Deltaproteobacteria bacterium]|nr:hypothetical protein [Deltaproteobacteria bacterium]